MKPIIYKINALQTRLVILFTFLAFAPRANCQHVTIPNNGYTYQQNFNGLTTSGTWNNGSTLTGWYAASAESGLYTSFSTSAGGSENSGFYSFGSVNSVNGSGDRALGSINKDDSGDIAYGVLFSNTSGVTINSVTISLRAEQWRRVNTLKRGYQRAKVSYQVGSAIDVSASGLLANTFRNVNELFIVSFDTTKVNEGMDGNAPGNFATITAEIPVEIPNGHKFFLRILDENVYHVDAALAVDDVSVQFSTVSTNHIAVSSDYNLYSYMDQGILTDIPGDSPANIYTIPSEGNLNTWSGILSDFFSGNISNSLGSFEYEWVEFNCNGSGETYQILRKKNSSTYYWGTYVRRLQPTNETLTIQAPHPIKDAYTEKQATAVFEATGASVLMVAGTDRCNSTTLTSCAGTTDICNVNNQKFRRSDVAHDVETIFHTATVVLAGLEPNMKFVQLHGFGQNGNDPEFIVSAGLQNYMNKGGIDYPTLFKSALQASALPDKDIKIPHLDNYSQLAALDNVQGRYLNNYQGGNICTSETDPATVTNRFLHIEQYKVVRDNPAYYDDLASIIGSVFTQSNENNSFINILNADSLYQQNFNTLSLQGTTAAWMNDNTLNGWHAARSAGGPLTDYRIGTGSATNYGLYSFGSSQSSDRALGALNQDESGHFVYGVLFKNTSGETVRSINLTYRAEQWRVTTNAAQQRVKLSYAVSSAVDPTPTWMLNNAVFTNVQSGDLVTLLTGSGSNQAVNGNQNGNYTNININISVTVANGDYLFIRFYDENAIPGVDHAMALDDFAITFSSQQVMPVQLSYFNLERAHGNQIIAKWKTLYEIDCSHYTLDNAGDDLEWTPLAEIRSEGNSREPRSYTWTHDKPIREKNYYRLRQMDIDGHEQVLGIIYIQSDATSENLNATLYPNPATKAFKIETDSDISEATIRLWDKSMGRIMDRKDFSDFGRSQTIDVQSLSKGHYVVELRTRNGRLVLPLVINK